MGYGLPPKHQSKKETLMVRYVRDLTGRFSQRPHYEPVELDKACEKLLTEFFKPLYGEIPVPIETDDLTRLIERDVSDFDPGANLSAYGADVEGVTEFKPAAKAPGAHRRRTRL